MIARAPSLQGLPPALADALEDARAVGARYSVRRSDGRHGAPVEVKVEGLRPHTGAELALMEIPGAVCVAPGTWCWTAPGVADLAAAAS